LNRYSEQSSENFVMYWKAIAEAMGVPDRVLDLTLIPDDFSHHKIFQAT